ncbi:unnamed protein product [Parajaminaea phylloscopi]
MAGIQPPPTAALYSGRSSYSPAETLHSGAQSPPEQFIGPKRRIWESARTPWTSVLAHPYEGKGTHDKPYLIGWLPNDAENPKTWSLARKWMLTAFVSSATLAVGLASSAYAGATSSVKKDLGGDKVLLTLGVSLFVLGFACGPLLWAPLSEQLGRRNLFLFTFGFMTLWLGVSVASHNLAALLVFRFLAGAFGSSALTNSGGTIADCHAARQRGLAMAVFAAAPFLAPTLGPLVGGFLGEAGGWRWLEALLAIFAAVITIAGIFMHSETYAPYLLRQRAAKLTKMTGVCYRSILDQGADPSLAASLKVALSRPWKLLFVEPIVFILSIYTAIIYATLYSFFSAFPLEFQVLRGWSPGVGGLAFLGLLVGMVASIIYIIAYDNPRYVRKSDELDGVPPPEERLPSAMIGAVLSVIGLAWFTGTNGPSVHYIVPIIASVPFGSGLVLIFLGLFNYLVDAYVIYAASVLAANSTIRSLFGAAWPLFTPYMYQPGSMPLAKGIHVGAAIALALALLCMPAPFILYKKGAAIRSRCKYAAEAAEALAEMQASESQSASKTQTQTQTQTQTVDLESNCGDSKGNSKADHIEDKVQMMAHEPPNVTRSETPLTQPEKCLTRS